MKVYFKVLIVSIVMTLFPTCNKIKGFSSDAIYYLFFKDKILSNKIRQVGRWKWQEPRPPLDIKVYNNKVLSIDTKGRLFELAKNNKNPILVKQSSNDFSIVSVEKINDRNLSLILYKDDKHYLGNWNIDADSIVINYNIKEPIYVKFIGQRDEFLYTDINHDLYVIKKGVARKLLKDVNQIFESDRKYYIREDGGEHLYVANKINLQVEKKKVPVIKKPNEFTISLIGINHNDDMVFFLSFRDSLNTAVGGKKIKEQPDSVFIYKGTSNQETLLEGKIDHVIVMGKNVITYRRVIDTFYIDLYEFND